MILKSGNLSQFYIYILNTIFTVTPPPEKCFYIADLSWCSLSTINRSLQFAHVTYAGVRYVFYNDVSQTCGAWWEEAYECVIGSVGAVIWEAPRTTFGYKCFQDDR